MIMSDNWMPTDKSIDLSDPKLFKSYNYNKDLKKEFDKQKKTTINPDELEELSKKFDATPIKDFINDIKNKAFYDTDIGYWVWDKGKRVPIAEFLDNLRKENDKEKEPFQPKQIIHGYGEDATIEVKGKPCENIYDMYDLTNLYKFLLNLRESDIQIITNDSGKFFLQYNNKLIDILDALREYLNEQNKGEEDMTKKESATEENNEECVFTAPPKNNKLSYHQDLCKTIHETYIKKNHDYGDSFSETYKKLGPISAITRISDKYNRLVNLVTSKDDAKVHDESIDDTLMDLANYCIMTVMERHPEEWNEK